MSALAWHTPVQSTREDLFRYYKSFCSKCKKHKSTEAAAGELASTLLKDNPGALNQFLALGLCSIGLEMEKIKQESKK
jgi:hypothetical protein